MLKRFAQILALATPMLLVACNTGSSSTTTASGGTTTTTTGKSYAGTYTGSVDGVNAGPATFIISSSNQITGTFIISNRLLPEECPNTCTTLVEGTVTSEGVVKGDFVHDGFHSMQFNGKIDSTGKLTGTWFEYHFPEKGGNIYGQGPAPSGTTTTTTTTTKAGSCQGSYVGSIDPPTHEVRIAQRNRQLTEMGIAITGNDAIDNAATGGGGEDGGIYLTGSFAFETDANCNITKSNGNIFGIPTTLSGKVSSAFVFEGMSMSNTGPTVGNVDGNGVITGQQQEFGKEWVHGVLNGKFTAGGKI